MQIRPGTCSLARSSLVQTMSLLSVPACGRLAARKGRAANTITMATNANSWRTMASPLLLRRAWREVLEHFVHALVQVLDVLVRVIGECVARAASPDQCLGLRIEEIDHHSANFVCFRCGCCLT